LNTNKLTHNNQPPKGGAILKQMGKVNEFIWYSLSFYGKNGIYPFDCSDDIVASVAKFYALESDDFIGTSIDREKVRVMLGALGYREINKK
tara:strand:+ start:270 stop:542 length:273 start_codon:yes stop_codon:yes gene_type:complete